MEGFTLTEKHKSNLHRLPEGAEAKETITHCKVHTGSSIFTLNDTAVFVTLIFCQHVCQQSQTCICSGYISSSILMHFNSKPCRYPVSCHQTQHSKAVLWELRDKTQASLYKGCSSAALWLCLSQKVQHCTFCMTLHFAQAPLRVV